MGRKEVAVMKTTDAFRTGIVKKIVLYEDNPEMVPNEEIVMKDFCAKYRGDAINPVSLILPVTSLSISSILLIQSVSKKTLDIFIVLQGQDI